MVVGVGIIEVYIHESRSLKEKRGVMKSLIRRTQNEFNITIAEVDGHDNWKQGIIGFAVVGNDRSFVDSKMEMILNFVDNLHLAEVVNVRREITNYSDLAGRYDGGTLPDGFQES
jgi:uncharacterized protein YlxP (DUF503 family)